VSSGFSTRTLLRETLRNLRAGSAQAIAIAAVAGTLAFGLCLASSTELSSIKMQHDRLIERGAYVFSISDITGQPLDGSRCEELRTVPGVVAAGGIISNATISPTLSQSTTIAYSEGTPGLAQVLWPKGFRDSASNVAGVVVGAGLADRYGLRAGALFSAVDRSGFENLFAIGAVARKSERAEAFDRAILNVVAAESDIATCLVESRPSAVTALSKVLIGWFSLSETRATSYYVSDRSSISPTEQLNTRLSQYAPIAAGSIMVVLFSLVTMARRGDFALYAVLGLGKRGLGTILIVEYVLLLLIPSCVGLSVAIVALGSGVDQFVLDQTALDSLRFIFLASIAPVASMIAISFNPPLDYLRGR